MKELMKKLNKEYADNLKVHEAAVESLQNNCKSLLKKIKESKSTEK